MPFGVSCQNNANSTTTFQSGDDTNLIGSQIIGKAVKGDVGGNLNIRSLQDKSTYDAKQTSAGVSVSICVPPICAGASSISGSFGQDKTHANYASVKEVAGIYAGDGGFDVNVKGQTEFTGAVIATAYPAQAVACHERSESQVLLPSPPAIRKICSWQATWARR